MKQETKRITLKNTHHSLEHDRLKNEYVHTYVIETEECIYTKTLELFHTVDVPETLKEFRELHRLSKSKLLKWLTLYFRSEARCYEGYSGIIVQRTLDGNIFSLYNPKTIREFLIIVNFTEIELTEWLNENYIASF